MLRQLVRPVIELDICYPLLLEQERQPRRCAAYLILEELVNASLELVIPCGVIPITKYLPTFAIGPERNAGQRPVGIGHSTFEESSVVRTQPLDRLEVKQVGAVP